MPVLCVNFYLSHEDFLPMIHNLLQVSTQSVQPPKNAPHITAWHGQQAFHCTLQTHKKSVPFISENIKSSRFILHGQNSKLQGFCYSSLSKTKSFHSLFRSLSKFNLHRLQSIQKSAARIVTNLSKYTRITPHILLSSFSLMTSPWC